MKKRLLSIALALSLIAPVCATPTAEAYSAGDKNQVNVLSLGGEHSGIVTRDGTLLTWGDNESFQCGNGSREDVFAPTEVLKGVRSVSLGNSHSAAIKEDGSLWIWGLRNDGQLGDSKFTGTTPEKLMDGVCAVSLGLYHSAAVKKNGTLWMWGSNKDGKLGDGTTQSSNTPQKVMEGVATVALGGVHSAAVKEDGTLWMWGANHYGSLGNGTRDNSSKPTKVMDNASDVALGLYHSAAVKKDGTLWTWGSNSQGQLGIAAEVKYQDTPIKVMSEVIAVSLGQHHSAAIKEDGSLWLWGLNNYGQIGDGTTVDRAEPVKVMDNVVAVSLGHFHSAAIKRDGSVWVWGANSNGQLGLARTDSYIAVPTQLFGKPEQCVVALELNGGQGVSKIVCDKNSTITPPNNPSRDGYFFAGWYKDKACTKPWNFDTDKVTGDCTLYAKWEPKSTTTVIAEPSTQDVIIDGNKIVLNSYVLRNDQGYPVNFVKLRDVAWLLNGTEANFNVDWRNNAIRVDADSPYTTPNGAEMTVPTVLAAPAGTSVTPVLTGGVTAPLEAFLLTDANGGGHNYFKLRDIGKVAGFNVEWDGDRGIIVITTTEDYIG